MDLYKFAIQMELNGENHYKIFSEIVDHLRHAEEWIEDAEFGKRKPY